jgi:hypothetical protein
MLMSGLVMNAIIGIAFVWIAHAIVPDRMAEGAAGPPPTKPSDAAEPDLAEARWSAFRSLLIVFPIAFWFMLSGASTSYVPVMIKVASMGQQATNEGARLAGRSLIVSTIIGGVLFRHSPCTRLSSLLQRSFSDRGYSRGKGCMPMRERGPMAT